MMMMRMIYVDRMIETYNLLGFRNMLLLCTA